MFQTNYVEKIKTHVLCLVTFSENRSIWDNVEQFCRATDVNIIQRMRIACWIPKATNTRTQVVYYSLLFHGNDGCTNAPHCYAIRILPLLLILPCSVGLNVQMVSFHLTFPPESGMRFYSSPVRAVCSIHRSIFYFGARILGKHYRSWSSSFVQSRLPLALLDPNIFFGTLFSNTLTLCASLNVRDQVSRACETKLFLVLFWFVSFTPIYSI